MNLNNEILLWLQQLRNPVLNEVMLAVTNLVWLIPAAAAVGLCFKKTRKKALIMLISIAAALLAANLIKTVVHEPRPFTQIAGLTRIGPMPGGSSFPSAHTACAFTLFWTLCFLKTKRGRILSLVLACLIAFSRMYLGVHYPLDVIGGILVSCITSWIVVRLYEYVKERRRSHASKV